MAQAFCAHSTSTTTLNLDVATQILRRGGMRLETNGEGFQIAYGRQILLGCGRHNYELTAPDVVEHVRRTLVR